MRFSDQFNITCTEDDTWFDPVLAIDTQLFIDPFLIFKNEVPFFEDSHAELVAYFNAVFHILASTGGNQNTAQYGLATDRLCFPEVHELCLGYTARGTRGSGSGLAAARKIASAMWSAIQAGLTEVRHFEEIQLLGEGIGADRISDATAYILRHRLIAYTQSICAKYNVPTETRTYRRGRFNPATRIWERMDAALPVNPNTRNAILLVPWFYLRHLPTLSPEDFWDYYVNENETLRAEFSSTISSNVSKQKIIETARRHIDQMRRYVATVESQPAQPYDRARDPKGLVQWVPATVKYCGDHPIEIVVTREEDFLAAIRGMCHSFQHFVEQNSGWELLWNDNRTSKAEAASQLLYYGIVKHYCKANNIDITPEANVGRGPVDFKFSVGQTHRALLEAKLARNSKFWHGLEKQLPTYMTAEEIKTGWFMIICYDDRDIDRVTDINRIATAVGNRLHYRISTIVIDARRGKPSASKA